MMCSNCGQVTKRGTAWGLSFIPCNCPIDKEAEKKRYELLRKKLDEAMVRVNAS